MILVRLDRNPSRGTNRCVLVWVPVIETPRHTDRTLAEGQAQMRLALAWAAIKQHVMAEDLYDS